MEDKDANWEIHNPSALPRGLQGGGNLPSRHMLASGSMSKFPSKVRRAGVLTIVHVGGCG